MRILYVFGVGLGRGGYAYTLQEYSGGWDVVPVVGQVGIGEFLLLRHRVGPMP